MNRRTVGIVVGGIAGLALVALIAFYVILQRTVDEAMARALIGGLSECSTHAKATGFDSHGLPKGPVTAAFVEARADANLLYPGATTLKRSTRFETFCGLGMAWSPAQTDIQFSTGDPIDVVNRWYTDRLAGEGWRECAEELHMTPYRGETNRFFHRGNRESYYVDHFVPAYPSPPPGNLFTVTYSIDPYVDPSIPPGWSENCTLIAPSA
jgi:hypothetical protein